MSTTLELAIAEALPIVRKTMHALIEAQPPVAGKSNYASLPERTQRAVNALAHAVAHLEPAKLLQWGPVIQPKSAPHKGPSEAQMRHHRIQDLRMAKAARRHAKARRLGRGVPY